MTAQRNKQGFNLVEAAIVLGIIGLIIGGIWVAAASMRENMRVNKLVADIGVIIENARNLFPRSNYPNNGFTTVTQAAFDAGVFPRDFKMSGTTYAIAPDGTLYRLQTSCNGGNGLCPALALQIFLRYTTVTANAQNSLSTSECLKVAQRVSVPGGAVAVLINSPNGSTGRIYLPPIDPLTFECLTTDGFMDMRYSK